MVGITQIAIVNVSTCITDVQGQNMTDALNYLLPTFCKDWSLPVCIATYIKLGKTTNIPTKIVLLDNTDEPSALGYHDLKNNIPYGKVFAKTILLSGGSILYNSNFSVPTVAQALSHEVFELLVNPICNSWWQFSDSGLCPSEVGDPVEGNIVTVTLSYNKPPSRVQVGMSDWILPAWKDPQSTKGPYNHLNTLTAPFQLSHNGYEIIYTNGIITTVFGERVSQWKKDFVQTKHRVQKHLKKTI